MRSETRRLFVGGGSGGGGGGVDDDVIVVAAVDTCYVRRRTFRQPLYLRNYPIWLAYYLVSHYCSGIYSPRLNVLLCAFSKSFFFGSGIE